jgi:hypothetical protein
MQVKEPLPKSLPNTGCWELAFVYFRVQLPLAGTWPRLPCVRNA